MKTKIKVRIEYVAIESKRKQTEKSFMVEAEFVMYLGRSVKF